MKTLTIIGKDDEDNLQNYHIVNPMNLVITKGKVTRPGHLDDPAHPGQKMKVTEERTFIYVGGQPVLSTEPLEVVVERAKEL
jgi:hypothetical protein